ncbi:MAG TPA: hypothetical protein H9915_04620 [Candidatus Gemmiger faecigallinarum]|nr:hypothetical protein [Candidatus Gemmiger faecigallinarum]
MSDPQLNTPRQILVVGCALGVAASVTMPWFTVSCILYALSALAMGVGCFLARKVQTGFNIVWKAAIPTVIIELLGGLLTQYDLTLLTTLMTAILFYFIMTYAVSGLAGAFHIRTGSDPRRPPRAAMLFEYAAGVYALARLISDMLPALNLIADLIAMVAMTVGFVVVLQFIAKLRYREE